MRRTQEDAERAIQTMNGMVVGQWRVRCGWANHKQVGPVKCLAQKVFSTLNLESPWFWAL